MQSVIQHRIHYIKEPGKSEYRHQDNDRGAPHLSPCGCDDLAHFGAHFFQKIASSPDRISLLPTLAGAEGFEPPSSVLETDSLTVELTPLCSGLRPTTSVYAEPRS